jgi:uncharacterized membrane protein YgcG
MSTRDRLRRRRRISPFYALALVGACRHDPARLASETTRPRRSQVPSAVTRPTPCSERDSVFSRVYSCRCTAELPATAGWAAFELYARHRGKEVGIVLVERAAGCPAHVVSPSLDPGSSPAGPCCPTCAAIGCSVRGGGGGSGRSGGSSSEGPEREHVPLAPKCEHGEVAALLQVKKNSANKGRWFFSCCVPIGRGRGRSGGSRCNFFKWADDVSGALQANPALQARMDRIFEHSEHTGLISLGAEAGEVGEMVRLVKLTFRRGMKGRFVLLTKEMMSNTADVRPDGAVGAQQLIDAAHFTFERSDGAVLAFVDRRPRVSDTALWHEGLWGAANVRGPDPVAEYSLFRAHVLDAVKKSRPQAGGHNEKWVAGERGGRAADLWERPICEVLLDQRFFNGVGNYVRAELLWEAKVAPFEPARTVLFPLVAARESGNGDAATSSAKGGEDGGRGGGGGSDGSGGGGDSSKDFSAKGRRGGERGDFLETVRDVLVKCVQKHGDKRWLSVFRKRYSNKEVDSLGRIIWYRGDRGPLPGPQIIKSPWHSLMFSRIPPAVSAGALRALVRAFVCVCVCVHIYIYI